MKKELTYLGIGLLFSLNSLRQSEDLISWEIKIVFGIIMMIYGSYLLYINHEKSKTLKFIVPAWSVFLIVGSIVLFSSNDSKSIYESDLKPATNFEGITTCDEGKMKAKEDIKNGKVRYIFGSFGARQPLAKNLKEKYNVEIIEVEGVVGMPNECYNQIMYKEIQKRYGQDVFNKAYE